MREIHLCLRELHSKLDEKTYPFYLALAVVLYPLWVLIFAVLLVAKICTSKTTLVVDQISDKIKYELVDEPCKVGKVEIGDRVEVRCLRGTVFLRKDYIASKGFIYLEVEINTTPVQVMRTAAVEAAKVVSKEDPTSVRLFPVWLNAEQIFRIPNNTGQEYTMTVRMFNKDPNGLRKLIGSSDVLGTRTWLANGRFEEDLQVYSDAVGMDRIVIGEVRLALKVLQTEQKEGTSSPSSRVEATAEDQLCEVGFVSRVFRSFTEAIYLLTFATDVIIIIIACNYFLY